MDFKPTYESINVLFPEFFSDGLTDYKDFEKGKIWANGTMKIRWGDFGIQVRKTNHVPGILLEDSSLVSKINEEIFVPIREEIISDLESSKEVIEYLRELNRDGGKFENNMDIKKRSGIKDEYLVYDYSHFSNLKPTEVLLQIRNLPRMIVKQRNERGNLTSNDIIIDPRYEGTSIVKYLELAQHVSEYRSEVPHVEGSSLKEAMERIKEIYSLAEELRDISFR